MTPAKKGKTTVIRIEKVRKTQLDEAQVAHVAGGQHAGLVINKQADPGGHLVQSEISMAVNCECTRFYTATLWPGVDIIHKFMFEVHAQDIVRKASDTYRC